MTIETMMELDRIISLMTMISNSVEFEKITYIEPETGIIYLNETSDNFNEHSSTDVKKMVDDLLTLLDDQLITQAGGHNTQARVYLRQKGIRFYPGESDNFGPLSSVISNDKFRLVYG